MNYLRLAAAIVLMLAAMVAAFAFFPRGISGGSLSVVASQTTCTAPCPVLFDATATTHPSTSIPFHELGYKWSFGDAGAGNWSYGSSNSVLSCGGGAAGQTTYCSAMPTFSRNADFGPLAAHVYDTPSGTPYTASMTLYAGSSVVGTRTVNITVNDPLTIYGGNWTGTTCNFGGAVGSPASSIGCTVCLSPTSNYTNCPGIAGHDPLGVCCVWQNIVGKTGTPGYLSSLAAACGNAVCRVLLHAGETFNTNATAADVPALGCSNCVIDSYDTGAQPIIAAAVTFSNIVLQEVGQTNLGGTSNSSNVTIRNVQFDGFNYTNECLEVKQGLTKALFENVTCIHASAPFGGTTPPQNTAPVTNSIFQNISWQGVGGYINQSITGAVAGTNTCAGGISNQCVRLTITDTTPLGQFQSVCMSGINGTTEANGNHQIVQIIDMTHVEINVAFANTYISAGNIQPTVQCGAGPEVNYIRGIQNAAFLGLDFENAFNNQSMYRMQSWNKLVLAYSYFQRPTNQRNGVDIRGDTNVTTFYGTGSGNNLTVTVDGLHPQNAIADCGGIAACQGQITVGQVISGVGVPAGTTITMIQSGSGGAGVYTTSLPTTATLGSVLKGQVIQHYANIHHNIHIGDTVRSGPQMSVDPQSSPLDGKPQDIIWDSNYCIIGPNSSYCMSFAEASNITIRNNIIQLRNLSPASTVSGIEGIWDYTAAQPQNVWVYNNTMDCGTTILGPSFGFWQYKDPFVPGTTTIKNNIYYCANTSTPQTYVEQVSGPVLFAGGSGGATGTNVSVTVSGGTVVPGGVAGVLKVDISGGQITNLNLTNPPGTGIANGGFYSVLPSNPVTVTGNSLVGAQFTITPTATPITRAANSDNIAGNNTTSPAFATSPPTNAVDYQLGVTSYGCHAADTTVRNSFDFAGNVFPSANRQIGAWQAGAC